jgi:hypothetical protein
MQLLGRHWADGRVGLYHLVFLSHMSFNVLEYARSQLEWMSDSLAKVRASTRPRARPRAEHH